MVTVFRWRPAEWESWADRLSCQAPPAMASPSRRPVHTQGRSRRGVCPVRLLTEEERGLLGDA